MKIPVRYGRRDELAAALRSTPNDDGRRTAVVVGAGFYGAVLAERLATLADKNVVVLERRDELGGNCAAFFDSETGIEIHRYGSHIFHTNSDVVWRYLTRFVDLNSYRHRVLTTFRNRVYPTPISLATINAFFGTNLKPSEVAPFLRDSARRSAKPESTLESTPATEPTNLEEKAISLVGEELYRALIEGYTTKQWGRSPRLLPPEIIARLPVRDNYNVDYFNDSHQGIPNVGYAETFERLLGNPKIRVFLGVDYLDVRNEIPNGALVVYTGALDRLFERRFGALEWRGLRFETETLSTRDFQGIAVMNFADVDVPYTRIHEFKHYRPERVETFAANRTVVCREFPTAWKPGDDAYYPVDDLRNRTLYQKYAAEAAKLPNFYVGGRLGAYRYWDMDDAIENALAAFEKIRSASRR